MNDRREKWLIALGAIALMVGASAAYAFVSAGRQNSHSATEAGFDEMEDEVLAELADPYINWQRPDGPLRVGLQAGHWKAKEAPDELENIRANGAYAAGISEWEVNLEIAEAARDLLEPHGIAVDILPATVPPAYWADAFVSIHADDNDDTRVSGYKVAAPRRDRSGRATELATLLETHYGEVTRLPLDPNVTRNMRGYYAFNYRKYEHAIHPMTPAAILETGFLSSPEDRRIIARDPEKAAQGLVDALLEFLGVQPTTAPTED
jgi:hypothetical protein